ncbi:hypothetical protein JOB18_016785 [Solea senegalensis]|uniref:Uncharacterized protein n=1 Tax=Solea senegalensis TaxID=28829 RepID=A0AAV6RC43_SOLSE|nr:hypothetical protein JOB18_016785 [Solea senegalensis]
MSEESVPEVESWRVETIAVADIFHECVMSEMLHYTSTSEKGSVSNVGHRIMLVTRNLGRVIITHRV